jgi:hypothetical protein
MNNQAGKGDKPRPYSATTYGRNFGDIRKECGCPFGVKCCCEKVKIVFARDLPICECCEDSWCSTHNMHYADCPCIGPGNAEEGGYILKELDGQLYGFR